MHAAMPSQVFCHNFVVTTMSSSTHYQSKLVGKHHTILLCQLFCFVANVNPTTKWPTICLMFGQQYCGIIYYHCCMIFTYLNNSSVSSKLHYLNGQSCHSYRKASIFKHQICHGALGYLVQKPVWGGVIIIIIIIIGFI